MFVTPVPFSIFNSKHLSANFSQIKFKIWIFPCRLNPRTHAGDKCGDKVWGARLHCMKGFQFFHIFFKKCETWNTILVVWDKIRGASIVKYMKYSVTTAPINCRHSFASACVKNFLCNFVLEFNNKLVWLVN